MKDIIKLVAVATTVALLAACGAGPSTHETGAGPAGKTGVEQGARPYIGKPRPPVSVSLAPGAPLESGVPGRLTLQVRSGAPLEAVRLKVEGDEGLTVVGFEEVPSTPGSTELAATLGAERQIPRFDVQATPTSGGTRYISGLLSFRINGVDQATAFRLPIPVGGPVTVGPVSAKPQRPPTWDAAGELIDSMPAETTVK